MPSTTLPALERLLEASLLELEKLHLSRPSLPTAMARAEAGQRIDDLLDAIAELQRMIDTSPAETLEDAAVKLRPRCLRGGKQAHEAPGRRSGGCGAGGEIALS